MRKLGIILASAVLIGGLMVGGASAQDATPQSDGVALAIYNTGDGAGAGSAHVHLQAGLNTINFTDVASGIDPTSVTFVSLTDPTGTDVLEQNYVYDLVNSAALLAALHRPADRRDHHRRHGIQRDAAERQRRRHHSAPGRRTGDRRQPDQHPRHSLPEPARRLDHAPDAALGRCRRRRRASSRSN